MSKNTFVELVIELSRHTDYNEEGKQHFIEERERERDILLFEMKA